MTRRALNRYAAFLCLFLAGCFSNDPTGRPYPVDNIITEISFRGAHKYDDCGAKRGCRAVYVDDTWYINFCSVADKSDCFWRSITHAPWEWQQKGTRVTVVWEPRERQNRIVSITLTESKEQVRL